jgi:uncharacterized protein (DUF305 family)
VRGRLGWWVAVALLAAGCAAGPRAATSAPAGGPAAASAAGDQADVWFMWHMVPHLLQETAIATLTRDRIVHPELARLADAVARRGRADVAQLVEWLAVRGLAPHGHSHQRADRPRETDLARLSRLRGGAFDLALVEVLAARQRAGMRLAAAEARDGAVGEVRRLARRLLSEQRARVRLLERWRRAWSAGRAAGPGEARRRAGAPAG